MTGIMSATRRPFLIGAVAAVLLVSAAAGGTAGSGVATRTGGTLGDSAPQRVPSAVVPTPASVSVPESSGSVSTVDVRATSKVVASSSTNGIPSAALAAYQRAESVINAADPSCNLAWQLVAAIGRVESDHGRYGGSALDADGVAVPGIVGVALDGSRGTALISDTDAGQYDDDPRFDRAVGPMQVIPATWSAIGVDADNDGVRNPQDVDDAALAAAVYLCSGANDLGTVAGQRQAVFRYNHSAAYVDLVLALAENYLAGDYLAVPNGVVSAGYLTAVPSLTRTSKTAKPERRDAAEPAPIAQPEPPIEPRPEPKPQRDPEPESTPSPLPKLPKLPPIPALPQTSIKPVDDVLTLAQALVQCTLDGLLDNPLNPTDRFDVCVDGYTHGSRPTGGAR